METTANKRALIYCRTATDNSTSLAAQEAACREAAKREGYNVEHVVHETISGYSPTIGRLFLNEARELMKKGGFEALIVSNLDRLSRDQLGLITLVREIAEAKVELICALEPKIEEEEIALTSIRNYIAYLEREKIKERAARGGQ